MMKFTEMPEVVSVFENKRRSLHTTHSWDFIGLVGEETMEIPGFSTKDQVNVIIGFIDTGLIPTICKLEGILVISYLTSILFFKH